MTKPATATLPRWANSGGATTEPPSGKKDIGWIDDEEPSAEYQNWLNLQDYNWLAWVDTRVFDGYVQPTEGVDVRIVAASGYAAVQKADTTMQAMRGDTPGTSDTEFTTVSYVQGYARQDNATYDATHTLTITSGASPVLMDWDYASLECGAGITASGNNIEFDEAGIYHIDAWVIWGTPPTAPYDRQLQVLAPGSVTKVDHLVVHTGHTEAIAQSQRISFNFKVTTPASDVLQIGCQQQSGSSDSVTEYGFSCHFVAQIV